jgi:hypothetical protein
MVDAPGYLRWWPQVSFLLKPLFRTNHRWAMARGREGLREGLQKELAACAAR